MHAAIIRSVVAICPNLLGPNEQRGTGGGGGGAEGKAPALPSVPHAASPDWRGGGVRLPPPPPRPTPTPAPAQHHQQQQQQSDRQQQREAARRLSYARAVLWAMRDKDLEGAMAAVRKLEAAALAQAQRAPHSPQVPVLGKGQLTALVEFCDQVRNRMGKGNAARATAALLEVSTWAMAASLFRPIQ